MNTRLWVAHVTMKIHTPQSVVRLLSQKFVVAPLSQGEDEIRAVLRVWAHDSRGNQDVRVEIGPIKTAPTLQELVQNFAPLDLTATVDGWREAARLLPDNLPATLIIEVEEGTAGEPPQPPLRRECITYPCVALARQALRVADIAVTGPDRDRFSAWVDDARHADSADDPNAVAQVVMEMYK